MTPEESTVISVSTGTAATRRHPAAWRSLRPALLRIDGWEEDLDAGSAAAPSADLHRRIWLAASQCSAYREGSDE